MITYSNLADFAYIKTPIIVNIETGLRIRYTIIPVSSSESRVSGLLAAFASSKRIPGMPYPRGRPRSAEPDCKPTCIQAFPFLYMVIVLSGHTW